MLVRLLVGVLVRIAHRGACKVARRVLVRLLVVVLVRYACRGVCKLARKVACRGARKVVHHYLSLVTIGCP